MKATRRSSDTAVELWLQTNLSKRLEVMLFRESYPQQRHMHYTSNNIWSPRSKGI